MTQLLTLSAHIAMTLNITPILITTIDVTTTPYIHIHLRCIHTIPTDTIPNHSMLTNTRPLPEVWSPISRIFHLSISSTINISLHCLCRHCQLKYHYSNDDAYHAPPPLCSTDEYTPPPSAPGDLPSCSSINHLNCEPPPSGYSVFLTVSVNLCTTSYSYH